MPEFGVEYIGYELNKIGARLSKKIDIFLIGGCAMSFRGIKEATKDVDIVFRSKSDYKVFCDALWGAEYYSPVKITDEYGKLQADYMYENKDGFHLDLFIQQVCGRLKLSKAMVRRAEFFNSYGSLNVYLVAKEDIFLFKALASEGRKRDLDDMRVIYPKLNWKDMGEELAGQKLSSDLIEHIISRFEEFRDKFQLDVPLLRGLRK